MLEIRLKAWADARGLPLQLKNQDFTPPNNAKAEDNQYLRAFLLPAQTVNLFLDGTHKLYRGVFQIDVVTPRGIGSAAAIAVIAGLIVLFPTNLRLTNLEGFTVQQLSPLSEGPGLEGASDYIAPLSFTYRADTVS